MRNIGLVAMLGVLSGSVGFPSSTLAQVWTEANAPSKFWNSLAASADGCKLVAVCDYDGIFTSTDSGLTWLQVSNSACGTIVPTGMGTQWESVASSADGVNLATVSFDGYGIYTSTNSGVDWRKCSTSLSQLKAVTASADGKRMAAAMHYGGRIYASTNSGLDWFVLTNSPQQNWSGMASSADGNLLIAVSVNYNPIWDGGIYISRDAGAAWTKVGDVPGTNWFAVATSADGQTMAAAALQGPIYVSTNGGGNWMLADAPSHAWTCVASSADGMKVIAGSIDGGIYSSTNYGITWSSNSAPITCWHAVESSADGSRMVAADHGGGIWTSQSASSPRLSLKLLGNNLVASWTVPSVDLLLQSNSDLTTTNWTDVGIVPNISNVQCHVVLPLTERRRFFRLRGS